MSHEFDPGDFFLLFGHDPIYWRGLRRHGLIDRHAGARLIQCLFTPRMRCFNEWAAPGGCLHEEVWKARRPLLIDRGCGGVSYENYPFDRALVQAYARRLGDRFLGVQFHECVSNIGGEWSRLNRHFPRGTRLDLRALQEVFDSRSWQTSFDSGYPSDFVGKRFPRTPREFEAQCREYLKRKRRDFHGHLTYVESYGITHAQAIRWGAKVVMPEHGHHIPMGRVHTAAARGAVRQHPGTTFGSYYAPWGNEPDSVPCHLPFTMWHTPLEYLCGDAFRHRGNGGSSRAFQRRLFHWAYLTGIRWLAEEWGPENTFHDWKDFDLTPYGQVVKDFMMFVRSVGRGRPVVPTAIVIDREWFGLDTILLSGTGNLAHVNERDRYFRFYDPPRHQLRVADFFRRLVGHRHSPPNDDARVLTAGAMPDAFDVILDDAPSALLGHYPVLAYVGERPSRFRARLRGHNTTIIELDDPAVTARAVTRATCARLPARVEGKVHWLLNRKPDAWQIGLFNPHGVTVDFQKGERSDPSATVAARVQFDETPKHLRVRACWPDRSRIVRRSGKTVEVEVGPGGLLVLEAATASLHD